MDIKRMVTLIIAILIIGGAIFLGVFYGTRDGTDKNLGQYEQRDLHSYNWCGDRKVIALTFDDGPNPNTTPQLLADLKRLDIKATFFMSPAVDGQPTSTHCALVKQVLKEGHSVQSHSYDHTNFMDKEPASIQANLKTNHNWLEECSDGERLSLSQFRPPFGSLDVTRAKFVSDLGYTIASWNIESFDYTGGSAATIFNNIVSGFNEIPTGGSAVVIMHDKHYHSSGTLGVLDKVVPHFKNLGYDFVTGDQCYKKCDTIGEVCKTGFKVWPGVFDEVY